MCVSITSASIKALNDIYDSEYPKLVGMDFLAKLEIVAYRNSVLIGSLLRVSVVFCHRCELGLLVRYNSQCYAAFYKQPAFRQFKMKYISGRYSWAKFSH